MPSKPETEAAPRTRLRVALDYRPALLGRSGIPRAVRELARSLAERDDLDVRLFGHSLARARVAPPPAARPHLHRLPVPGRSLGFLARLGLGAEGLAGGASVFHWTDYVYPPVRRAQTVVSIYDVSFAEHRAFHGPHSGVLLARCRRAAAAARAVLVPTEATARSVRKHLEVSENAVHVIPLGVDHVPADPGPDPFPDRPFVLALGTVEPRKNHARLLAAWRRLPAPRPLLVVAGRRGWECDEVAARLVAGQRAGELVWLRAAEDELVFRLLRHARLLVYPSLLEGFGFPPLEALAYGTPVVAGDTPALREVLGDAAVFCDPREPESIARALHDVATDAHARAELAARGRARAARYRWADCAAACARIYFDAASRAAAGAPTGTGNDRMQR